MTTSVYDAVVVGAGSVGMPTAMYLAEKGLKVLCVDQFASAGQGSNKAAIGGLRATHSSPAKIRLCLDSLKTFSTWKESHGFDIEWRQGGYMFVAYRAGEAKTLKELLVVQKKAGTRHRLVREGRPARAGPRPGRRRGFSAGRSRPGTGRPLRCSRPARSTSGPSSSAWSAVSTSASPASCGGRGRSSA